MDNEQLKNARSTLWHILRRFGKGLEFAGAVDDAIDAFARAIESALRAHPAAQEAHEPIAVAVALEQQRALKITEDVHNLPVGGRNEVMPTAFHAGWCGACEEIEHRLRTEQWELCGVPAPLPAAQEEASEPDYWAVLHEDGSGVLVQRDKPDAPEWQRAKPDAADWDAAYPGLAPHTVVPLFLAPAASAPKTGEGSAIGGGRAADATEQSLALYAAQADAIRELLDKHAPNTTGNLQTRIAAVLGAPSGSQEKSHG